MGAIQRKNNLNLDPDATFYKIKRKKLSWEIIEREAFITLIATLLLLPPLHKPQNEDFEGMGELAHVIHLSLSLNKFSLVTFIINFGVFPLCPTWGFGDPSQLTFMKSCFQKSQKSQQLSNIPKPHFHFVIFTLTNPSMNKDEARGNDQWTKLYRFPYSILIEGTLTRKLKKCWTAVGIFKFFGYNFFILQ